MEQVHKDVFFGSVGVDMIDCIFDLESQGFPPDEAASRDNMVFRIQQAPTFFVGTFLADKELAGEPQSADSIPTDQKKLIGYVVGTCCRAERLEHESMFQHDKDGDHLCIHSVLIEPAYQGRGYAKKALFNYIEHVKREAKHINRISLIAKESKTGLYKACGFKMVGVSPVVHGQDTWFELSISL